MTIDAAEKTWSVHKTMVGDVEIVMADWNLGSAY